MNYFAHGMHFTDRPYFLAGTATPDWLSVADRAVRLRPRRVLPFADGSDRPQAQFAAGVLQHLRDDERFHRLPSFIEVSGELMVLFRQLLHPHDGFRPGFLGHIVTEMLIDAVLIERNPDTLRAYYAALNDIDPMLVERSVNRMSKKTTERLGALIPLFCHEGFLWDYLDSERFLHRLNQVMRRVKLEQLPSATVRTLDEAREVVRRRIDDLVLIPESSPRITTKDVPT